MTRTLRALRGATTLDADTRDQVLERTGELMSVLMERNGVAREDIVSLLFTATEDISSEFPAYAVRSAGLSDVPMLCARELGIEGSLGLCIRVMVHLFTEREPGDLRHVYLHGASGLRTDLPQ